MNHMWVMTLAIAVTGMPFHPLQESSPPKAPPPDSADLERVTARMRDELGNILNPVFAGTGGPESILYYRNNAKSQGSNSNPPRMNPLSFDIWGYGCGYQSGSPKFGEAWEINNWQQP